MEQVNIENFDGAKKKNHKATKGTTKKRLLTTIMPKKNTKAPSARISGVSDKKTLPIAIGRHIVLSSL